jgi:tRNA G18 (ribose-2'-O)-methylase SpoU
MCLYCFIKGVSFASVDLAKTFVFMRKLSMEALNRPTAEAFKNSKKLPVVAVLDNLRSLANVGSIFRSADAFAINHLYLCGFTGTPPNRDIHKAALGAEESVAWTHFESTTSCIEKLKSEGYTVLAIEQTDESVLLSNFTFEKGKQYALVLGNEVMGVADEALALCAGALEVPQAGSKHSLNVSVCAGVVFWEAYQTFFNVFQQN